MKKFRFVSSFFSVLSVTGCLLPVITSCTHSNTQTAKLSIKEGSKHKTNFIEGQIFDRTGLVLILTQPNGQQTEISDPNKIKTNLDGFKLSKGYEDVVVSYQLDNGKSVVCSYRIHIEELVIVGIEIANESTHRAVYNVGSTDFSIDGLKLNYIYNDGNKKLVTAPIVLVSKPDLTTAGDKYVTVRTSDKSMEFTYTIHVIDIEENIDLTQYSETPSYYYNYQVYITNNIPIKSKYKFNIPYQANSWSSTTIQFTFNFMTNKGIHERVIDTSESGANIIAKCDGIAIDITGIYGDVSESFACVLPENFTFDKTHTFTIECKFTKEFRDECTIYIKG